MLKGHAVPPGTPAQSDTLMCPEGSGTAQPVEQHLTFPILLNCIHETEVVAQGRVKLTVRRGSMSCRVFGVINT